MEIPSFDRFNEIFIEITCYWDAAGSIDKYILLLLLFNTAIHIAAQKSMLPLDHKCFMGILCFGRFYEIFTLITWYWDATASFRLYILLLLR